MQFSGEETFELGQSELWDRVMDMEFLSRIIPDLDRVESIAPKQMVCRVRPSFAFLSGSFKLTFEVLTEDPPTCARMRVSGKGIGSTMVIETVLRLVAEDQCTKLAWDAEIVERRGLLKPVGVSLIQMSARKVIADALSNFRKAL